MGDEGVVGGHLEVEVEERRTETESFPEGWWIQRDSQPSPATVGGSSKRRRRRRKRKRRRGVTARRSAPGAVRSGQLEAPHSLASSLDLRRSGRALENRIPTHLKDREEREEKRQNI